MYIPYSSLSRMDGNMVVAQQGREGVVAHDRQFILRWVCEIDNSTRYSQVLNFRLCH